MKKNLQIYLDIQFNYLSLSIIKNIKTKTMKKLEKLNAQIEKLRAEIRAEKIYPNFKYITLAELVVERDELFELEMEN